MAHTSKEDEKFLQSILDSTTKSTSAKRRRAGTTRAAIRKAKREDDEIDKMIRRFDAEAKISPVKRRRRSHKF